FPGLFQEFNRCTSGGFRAILKGTMERRKMRRWSGLLGLALAFALLAWHGVGKPLPGGARTVSAVRRLVIGVRSDVTSLNIYPAASAFDQEIADLLYPKLAYEEDDFQQGPPTFR